MNDSITIAQQLSRQSTINPHTRKGSVMNRSNKMTIDNEEEVIQLARQIAEEKAAEMLKEASADRHARLTAVLQHVYAMEKAAAQIRRKVSADVSHGEFNYDQEEGMEAVRLMHDEAYAEVLEECLSKAVEEADSAVEHDAEEMYEECLEEVWEDAQQDARQRYHGGERPE